MSPVSYKCRFYFAAPTEVSPPETAAPSGLRVELWRPSPTELAPKGMCAPSLAVWWAFHRMHLFRNRRYSVLAIYEGQRPVHRSVVTPGWLRFPFMDADDLQIGATWTDPEYRGRGLAALAISHIVHGAKDSCARFWYLTEETNRASIRAVEKAGFTRYLEGRRTKRLGFRLLGAYIPDRRAD